MQHPQTNSEYGSRELNAPIVSMNVASQCHLTVPGMRQRQVDQPVPEVAVRQELSEMR